jgi:hypothetical protein
MALRLGLQRFRYKPYPYDRRAVDRDGEQQGIAQHVGAGAPFVPLHDGWECLHDASPQAS